MKMTVLFKGLLVFKLGLSIIGSVVFASDDSKINSEGYKDCNKFFVKTFEEEKKPRNELNSIRHFLQISLDSTSSTQINFEVIIIQLEILDIFFGRFLESVPQEKLGAIKKMRLELQDLTQFLRKIEVPSVMRKEKLMHFSARFLSELEKINR